MMTIYDNSVYVSEIHRDFTSHQGFTLEQHWCAQICRDLHHPAVLHDDFPWFSMMFFDLPCCAWGNGFPCLWTLSSENLLDKDQQWHIVFATTEQVQRHVANDEGAPKHLWLTRVSKATSNANPFLGLSEFIPLVHTLWKGVDAKSYESERWNNRIRIWVSAGILWLCEYVLVCVFVFVCHVVWDVCLFVKEFVLVFLSVCQSRCNLFCALFCDVFVWCIDYTTHSSHFKFQCQMSLSFQQWARSKTWWRRLWSDCALYIFLFNSHLSPSKLNIVVNAFFSHISHYFDLSKPSQDIGLGGALQTEFQVIFATAKWICLDIFSVTRSLFFISCQQVFTSSSPVADLSVHWLHQHAKFFQEIETTS